MENKGGGVSLATVLVAIFVVLKLTDVIDWSWWWVFSPWLIAFALGFFLVGLALLIEVIVDWEGPARRRRKRAKPYERPQDHNVSHIEPLDSIKNPRRS